MLEVRDGSCKYKYVTPTYSFIKFTDVPLFILHVATCIQIVGAEVLGPKWSSPCAVCWCVWSAGEHTAGCVQFILLCINVLLRMEFYGWIMVEGSHACVCVIRGVMSIVGFCWCGHVINILCTFGWNLTKIRSARHRITLHTLCVHLCTHSERNSTCTVTTKHVNGTHRYD